MLQTVDLTPISGTKPSSYSSPDSSPDSASASDSPSRVKSGRKKANHLHFNSNIPPPRLTPYLEGKFSHKVLSGKKGISA